MTERPQSIVMPAPTVLRSAMKHVSSPSLSSVTSTPMSPPGTAGTHDSSFFPPSTPSIDTPSLTPTMASSGYLPKVSFDTFENPSAPMFSYTLQAKSEGYKRDRSTRNYLVAASMDESGSEALGWVMEALVQDGDELIVFRGFAEGELCKGQDDQVREDARLLLKQIQKQNIEVDPDRKLSIIVEFIAGKVTSSIDRLIALYRPDSLVVGTRGLKSGVSLFGATIGGMGSVSKYCLSHSPVPVIVVRQESKVRKTMMKRQQNPKRGIHFEEKSPSISHLQRSPIASKSASLSASPTTASPQ